MVLNARADAYSGTAMEKSLCRANVAVRNADECEIKQTANQG